MDSLINWISAHWAELLTALGLGGGSGLAAKKLADKKQDAKIEVLEKEVSKLKIDMHTNTLYDEQFRQQVERDYLAIKEDMREVKGRLEQILNHLLSKK